MRTTRRLTIFVLTGLMTFLIGMFVAKFPRGNTNCPIQVWPTIESSPWLILLSFENRDLNRLDRQSEITLRYAIDKLRGKADSDGSPFFVPTLFQLISNTAGQPRYILVEQANLQIIPGHSNLRIHVFAADGKVLNVEEFALNRTVFGDIRIRKFEPMKHEVLMINTVKVIGGFGTRQFFTLVDDRIRLVFVEGYINPNWRSPIADVSPLLIRSVDDWETALLSSDDVEVMSALMWLNQDLFVGNGMSYHGEESDKVAILLARDGARRRVRELSQCPNQWKKTAARYILTTLAAAPVNQGAAYHRVTQPVLCARS